MGRLPKIPFEITPAVCRYLREIQFKGEDRLDSTIITRGKAFLVPVHESGEIFDSLTLTNLENLTTFLVREGMVRLLTFQEFEKELGSKFSDESSYEYLHDPTTNERFVFEKFFAVEVLDLQSIKKLRKNYCIREMADSKFVDVYKMRFEHSTATNPNGKIYTFKSKKNKEVFYKLWENREHFIKKGLEPHKKGVPMSLAKFLKSVGIISTVDASRDKVDKGKKQIMQIVGNVRRSLKDESFTMKLQCKPGKVLLTVREKVK